jgi:hypothetical protein
MIIQTAPTSPSAANAYTSRKAPDSSRWSGREIRDMNLTIDIRFSYRGGKFAAGGGAVRLPRNF